MKAAIEVEGAAEIARIFKDLGQSKDLTKAYRGVAKVYEPAARSAAASGSRQQAFMAKALKASASRTGASLAISGSASFAPSPLKGGGSHVKKPGGAVGSFFGAIPTGRGKRFPIWVTGDWQMPESGPHRLVEAYRTAESAIVQELEDGVYSMFRERGIEVIS